MLPYRLHPAADAEAIGEVSFIKSDDPIQAEIFKDCLEDAIEWACSQPLIFRCFEEDFRKVKVGKFRVNLVFRIRGDEIQILAVAHHRRLPGYWKERAQEDW